MNSILQRATLFAKRRNSKYSFIETEDFLEGFRIFNLLYYNKNIDKYIPIDELSADDNALLRHPNGREELDEVGMVIMDDNANASLFTTYDETIVR